MTDVQKSHRAPNQVAKEFHDMALSLLDDAARRELAECDPCFVQYAFLCDFDVSRGARGDYVIDVVFRSGFNQSRRVPLLCVISYTTVGAEAVVNATPDHQLATWLREAKADVMSRAERERGAWGYLQSKLAELDLTLWCGPQNEYQALDCRSGQEAFLVPVDAKALERVATRSTESAKLGFALAQRRKECPDMHHEIVVDRCGERVIRSTTKRVGPAEKDHAARADLLKQIDALTCKGSRLPADIAQQVEAQWRDLAPSGRAIVDVTDERRKALVILEAHGMRETLQVEGPVGMKDLPATMQKAADAMGRMLLARGGK